MELLRDGSGMVYVGSGVGGTSSQLWIRDWSNLEARPIPGTLGVRTQLFAGQIALSPDGREVACVTGNPGPLRVVPLAGGPSRTLVEEAGPAFDWTPDGFVYFLAATEELARVPAPGGGSEAVEILKLPRSTLYRWQRRLK